MSVNNSSSQLLRYKGPNLHLHLRERCDGPPRPAAPPFVLLGTTLVCTSGGIPGRFAARMKSYNFGRRKCNKKEGGGGNKKKIVIIKGKRGEGGGNNGEK